MRQFCWIVPRELRVNKALLQTSLHFKAIDNIKSKLEQACSGVVSCADIIVLAARESIVLVKLVVRSTLCILVRSDSTNALIDKANELPTPNDGHSETIRSFISGGMEERVALSGLNSFHSFYGKF